MKMWSAKVQLLPLLVSIVGGVAITLLVAFGAPIYSLQPQVLENFTSGTALTSSWLLIPEDATGVSTVWRSQGFAYRSTEVDYYDIAESAYPEYPPMLWHHPYLGIPSEETGEIELTKLPTSIRRSFVTELGWPNAVLETNARSIGRCFGLGASMESSPDDTVLDDGRPTEVRILWAGFFLSTTLFASIVLAVWLMIRRQPKCCYLSGFFIFVICAGLWGSIIVAWGCDLAYQLGPFAHSSLMSRGYHEDAGSLHSSGHLMEFSQPLVWDYFQNITQSSFGYRSSRVKLLLGTINEAEIVGGSHVLQLGWPLFCFQGSKTDAQNYLYNLGTDESTLDHGVVDMMHAQVRWPSLLANWFLYVICLLAIIRGPRVVRRYYRWRKKQCLHCGYPIVLDRSCPECGNDASELGWREVFTSS